MKIVINNCFGGFGLSREAYEFLGMPWDGYGHGSELERNDPKLIECIEKLGEKANGCYAQLKVVEIPDDVEWYIHDYDGLEGVYEQLRKPRAGDKQAVIIDELLEALENLAVVCNYDDQGEALKKAYEAIAKGEV